MRLIKKPNKYPLIPITTGTSVIPLTDEPNTNIASKKTKLIEKDLRKIFKKSLLSLNSIKFCEAKFNCLNM